MVLTEGIGREANEKHGQEISEYNYRHARLAYERGEMAYAAWAQAMAAEQSRMLRRLRKLEPMPSTLVEFDAERDERERIDRLAVAMREERANG